MCYAPLGESAEGQAMSVPGGQAPPTCAQMAILIASLTDDELGAGGEQASYATGAADEAEMADFESLAPPAPPSAPGAASREELPAELGEEAAGGFVPPPPPPGAVDLEEEPPAPRPSAPPPPPAAQEPMGEYMD